MEAVPHTDRRITGLVCEVCSRVGGFLYLLPSTSQFVEDLVYDDDNRFTALLTCSLVGR